ncbi:MAG TPA: aldo/keto reductase [Acidimicrobiales bacterium]|nr:aldo/keto reductase [Acidimicrobiales bacterium]
MTTHLPLRPFGSTGLELTAVGFGAWAIGGAGWSFAWGAQDDDESVAAIRHAVDAGVNWIDTAAVYGLGHSEEVVARALEGMAQDERPYVFTKCGLVWDESRRQRRVADPASIRREADASLRRLGVERIDLLQIHWPSEDGTPVEDSWAAMLELKAAGKVRFAGVSNYDVGLLEACEAVGHVDSLQPPFSAVARDAAADLLPWCAAHGTGVLVYSPMQSGLLTGAFDEARAASLPEDDWRSRSPDFRGDGLRRNLAVAGALAQIAEVRGVPTPAAAVAWTLAWPGVSAAIVGARRPDQVDGWLPAADLALTPEELDRVAGAIEASGAGSGPTRP